jgi:hypothetical protein
VDSFVDDDFGETTERSEELDAFDDRRGRLVPAGYGDLRREALKLPSRSPPFAERGPLYAAGVVSILSRLSSAFGAR